jgi:hypothetical protein
MTSLRPLQISLVLAALLPAATVRAQCLGDTCVTNTSQVALIPDTDGFNATENCPVTSDFAGGKNGMVSNYDIWGVDLGLSVLNPNGDDTLIFFGDTSTDRNGWNWAESTGHFRLRDNLCSGLAIDTLAGTPTVFAPDVMVAPSGVPISSFVDEPVAPGEGGATPSNAAVPGAYEVPTGAFAYSPDSSDHNVYLFYTTTPSPPNGPAIAASYLAMWNNPSPSTPGTITPNSPNTYQVLATVDNLSGTTPNLGGHFINVAAAMDGDGWLYLFGTGSYRASPVSLARMALGDISSIGACASPPCSLSQVPTLEIWSQTSTGSAWLPASAAPTPLALTADSTIGELSVRYIPAAGLWVMMYTPQGSGQVMMLWSLSAEGPWTADQVVIPFKDSADQSMYCCQGPLGTTASGNSAYTCLDPDGNPAHQQIAECKGTGVPCGGTTCGPVGKMFSGMYAPYLLPLAQVDVSYGPGSGARWITQVDVITLHFLLSNSQPYGATYFTTTLQASIPYELPPPNPPPGQCPPGPPCHT